VVIGHEEDNIRPLAGLLRGQSGSAKRGKQKLAATGLRHTRDAIAKQAPPQLVSSDLFVPSLLGNARSI
jgi:hypothetical protein